jgi:hypothetical protein
MTGELIPDDLRIVEKIVDEFLKSLDSDPDFDKALVSRLRSVLQADENSLTKVKDVLNGDDL